ncbi:MAG: HAD-IC family P-type ATPase [Bacilli bacterium]
MFAFIKKIFPKNLSSIRLQRDKERLQKLVDESQRYTPSIMVGLTNDVVLKRKEAGLSNKKKKVVTKSYWKIIFDNLFSFFNVLLYTLGVLCAIAGKYTQLSFLGVISINAVIGLIQDIRARKLVDKLSIINKMESTVIRDSVKSQVLSSELVLDDIVYIKNGEQIPADSIIIEGKCSVNEAMLTGEPDAVKKNIGDVILSGTYVSSGSCYARINKVGKLNKAEELQEKASIVSKPKSEILAALNYLFGIIGMIVILLGVVQIVSYWYINPSEFSWEMFAGTPMTNDGLIGGFVGSMVAMIPAGMFLLASIALSVGVLTLAKKRCLVQELYCIEMLARVDTLCLDKTGTITDGTMVFADYIRIDKTLTSDNVGAMIASVIKATNDDNYTSKALFSKFGSFNALTPKNILAFSSDTKFSAADFDKEGTYAIGAYGYIDIDNKVITEKTISKYNSKGYRCLLLCQSKKGIVKEKLPKMTCVGIILLEDHIREDAPETLAWFASNGVDIRVISGDDPATVSEIAKKAGIQDYEKYISLDGKSIDEVMEIANDYKIFGRVSPEQKEALVISLKHNYGKTVAMTGDGVNDILALKRADCSIAMASGSDAAKNASHLVLLDSNFSVLPTVVAEGRRVINNLQRSSALFLSKTLFTMALTILFIIMTFATRDANMTYPLNPNHYYVWEISCIGVGGFFLSLEPNSAQIKGKFFSNAIKKAVPIATSIFFMIVTLFILLSINEASPDHFILGDKLILNSAGELVSDGGRSGFIAMCAIIMALFGFVSLYKICTPFSKYRLGVFITISILSVALVTGCYMIKIPLASGEVVTFGYLWFLFEITDLKLLNVLWVLVIFLIGTAFYLWNDKKFENMRLFDMLEKFREKTESHENE